MIRLADVDTLAQEGIPIPPLEVRLDLQPGDRVALFEELRHPTMGSGFSPVEVTILGSPEPGWFVGQTDEGEEVEFNADQVGDIELGSPSMGGIFDWFKRLKPGAKPAPVPPSVIALPATPVPTPITPKEKKTLLTQLKTILKAPLIAKKEEAGPAKKARGIFDVFKKPEVEPGLPIERGAMPMAPREEKPSIVSFFKSEEKVVIPFLEKLTEPMKIFTEEHKVVIPFVEAITAPAQVFPKSPEREPFEVREAKQMEFWASVIPEAERKPSKPVYTVFEEKEVQPAEEVIPPTVSKGLHRSMKVLPLPKRGTLLPSVEDVVRGLMTFYEPIDELFEMLYQERNSEAWQEELRTEGYAKYLFESFGTCGGPPTYYEEFASFLHIPWNEFMDRGKFEDDELVDDEQIWMDLIFPGIELITEAMNLLKPAELPGTFLMDWNDDHKCMLVLGYEERAGKGTPIVSVSEETDPRQLLTSLEDSVYAMRTELERLPADIPELQTIRKELEDNARETQEHIDQLRAMLEELEEETEPPAKRTPEKRKGRKKRGK